MKRTHSYAYDSRKFPLTITREVTEVDEDYEWDEQGAEPPFLYTHIQTKLIEESDGQAHDATIIICSASVTTYCDGLSHAPLSSRLLNLIADEAKAIRTKEAYMTKHRSTVPAVTRHFLALT